MPAPSFGPSDRIVLVAVAGACVCLLALALATMGAMHERHYRDRRRRLLEAHLGGLELRLSAVESILREDRLL